MSTFYIAFMLCGMFAVGLVVGWAVARRSAERDARQACGQMLANACHDLRMLQGALDDSHRFNKRLKEQARELLAESRIAHTALRAMGQFQTPAMREHL